MGTVLLRGGRVIDPASGLDDVRDVLIVDDRVAALGPDLEAPHTADVIDVSDLIVGPGFVDLHSHVHSIAGQRLQACDGVTTSLDLEAGLMPIDQAYADAAAAGRPLHYGFSASWGAARAAVHLGHAPDATLRSALAVAGKAEWQRSSTATERAQWLGLLEDSLEAGALGVGVLLGYAPRSDPAEFLAVARLAASAGVPTFTHARELVESDPMTPIDGPGEIVAAALETGAAMHMCHVNSTSRRHLDRVLALLETAQSNGARTSVEAYPYGSASTSISAAFLAPERLGAWGITASSIILLATGERLADARRLSEVRATDPGAACIVEFLDDSDADDVALLRRGQAFPDAIVASDALSIGWPDGSTDTRAWPLPPGGKTHPRTAGTFAKTMRTMVRESGQWTWLEAFRRAAYLPAQLLAEMAPAMRAKGRLSVGADADLVVLDPATLSDAATYLDPTRPSVGVTHLLVAGEFVIRDRHLQQDAYPGRAVRSVIG